MGVGAEDFTEEVTSQDVSVLGEGGEVHRTSQSEQKLRVEAKQNACIPVPAEEQKGQGKVARG